MVKWNINNGTMSQHSVFPFTPCYLVKFLSLILMRSGGLPEASSLRLS